MKILLTITLIFGICQLSAQYKKNAGPLRVGDKVPEILLSNVKNYPGGKLNLSRFKGKLIIIDFWNSSCRSCIKAMPKTQELQDRFKDKVQIIYVFAPFD